MSEPLLRISLHYKVIGVIVRMSKSLEYLLQIEPKCNQFKKFGLGQWTPMRDITPSPASGGRVKWPNPFCEQESGPFPLYKWDAAHLARLIQIMIG